MSQQVKLDGTIYLYRRLFGYIKPYWVMLLLGVLGTAIYAGVDSFGVYLLKPLLNEGFIAKNRAFIQWMPLLMLVAFMLRGIASFISTYGMTWVARSVVLELRRDLFSHFLKLPASFYDNNTSGQLLAKLLYDVEQVAVVGTEALTSFVESSCFVVGLFIVMLTISWRLSLIYFITAPFIAVIVKVANQRTRRVSHSVQESIGKVTEIAEETIEGYRAVRTFGGENYEYNKFSEAIKVNRRRELKVAITKSYSDSSVQLIAAAGISLIIYFAINPAYSTMLSAGGFISMVTAMLALLKPLKNLTAVNSMIQRGLAGAKSIFDMIDLPSEPNQGKKVLSKVDGSIEFNHVSFAYNEKSGDVLKDISFSVKPGQVVALVGRSGSGKSTIAALLTRFYEIHQGMIRIDGCDICELELSELRKHIAIVSQNLTLFNDTIANNIAYGRTEQATAQQIKNAAVAAHAMEFIEHLPQGLQSLIGENGVLLSGGQRQRIAIARAILKNAPILILDEATSALDTESERHIQSALEAVMQNRTTLVIAHRLSTIENADQIIVMQNGQIVEIGTHTQLLQKNGHYSKLHAMQFQDNYEERSADEAIEVVS
ncbi:MAG: lipid A export permease/ATP-binding protein MsbA [Proteobacteria bacterium]|nr:lipid A export permease/ATP-binding protein MsbA [Pseudomonadota bacterium]